MIYSLRGERPRREARREKFTRENCTIPTIHLGLVMMIVVMIKMIVITIVSSVLFEGDIPSWQRGGQYPSCHFFTPHDNHDVDDNLIKFHDVGVPFSTFISEYFQTYLRVLSPNRPYQELNINMTIDINVLR